MATEAEKKAADAAKNQSPEAAKAAEAVAAKPENAKKVAERGPVSVAVNEIHQTNPETGDREVIPAGTVFEPAKADYQDYLNLGAIAEPNETQIVMYERVKEATKASSAAADLG